jgi:hypothetical protein
MLRFAIASSSTALHFRPDSFAARICCRICISFLQPVELGTIQLPTGDIADIKAQLADVQVQLANVDARLGDVVKDVRALLALHSNNSES